MDQSLADRPPDDEVLGPLAPARHEPAREERRRDPGQVARRLLTAALVAVAVAGWIQSDRAADRNARTSEVLATGLDAAEAKGGDLARRVRELEAQAGGRLDVAAAAPAIQASVFTVLTPDNKGSAWVARVEGGRSLLVTNYHVVAPTWERGDPAVTATQPALSLPGTVVAVDQANDLALVAVDQVLPVLPRAGTEAKVGTEVVVVGSPLGFQQTIATGIVSAVRDGEVQLSAPLSPGSSGGPVLNAEGEVVAVTVRKVTNDSAEGLGFAVPIARLCDRLLAC